MRKLTPEEMAALPEGGGSLRTLCGMAVGVTAGSTLMFGLTGFLLTFNKSVTLCGLSAIL